MRDTHSKKIKKVLSMSILVIMMFVCNSKSYQQPSIPLKEQRNVFQFSIKPFLSVSLTTSNRGISFAVTLGDSDE